MKNTIATFLTFAGIVFGSFVYANENALVQVKRAAWSASAEYEGQIEAETDTRIAAQVAGVVKQVHVKAGDNVKAGQLLIEIDSTQARQQQAALQAQADAAEARLHALTRELERQQQLFAQKYISQGALERIQAEQLATAAQLKAQQAQARAARVQTEFFVIRAPYDGVVVDVPATQGDMAMPGMPLLNMFDPARLRVGVSVPVSVLPVGDLSGAQIRVLRGEQEFSLSRVQRLPTADAGSQTVRLRLTLAGQPDKLVPGQAVKVQLQRAASSTTQRLYIPAAAVIRRAELVAVYVRSELQNKPVLRQLRLGEQFNGEVEVLSGLSEGEWIYLDQHVLGKE